MSRLPDKINMNDMELRIVARQREKEVREMMQEVVADHRADLTVSDVRFSKKVKEALVGKNVSHHKVAIGMKVGKGLWAGAKAALGSIIPGIDIASSILEGVGSIGNAYLTSEAKSGHTVSTTAAEIFNVNLNAQILEKIQSIHNHGESLSLWGEVFKKYSMNGIKSKSDLKDCYRAFRKLKSHVEESEKDFREMNDIFQKFYNKAKLYVETYRAQKAATETKLEGVFLSTVLNPETHAQCNEDRKTNEDIHCFIDFDIDNFFAMFPLALTAETFKEMKKELRHIEMPVRKFLLDTSPYGVLGIIGGTFPTSAKMEWLKTNAAATECVLDSPSAAMTKDQWKTASRLGFSLSGGVNARGKETDVIDTSVGNYATTANMAIAKGSLAKLGSNPGAAKAEAMTSLKLREASLMTLRNDLAKYLAAKQDKAAERKIFMERLKKLVEWESKALREAIWEVGRIV